MNSLTLKRRIKNPFNSPAPILITPSASSSSSPPSVLPHYPPSVSPNTIHTFNTADTDHSQQEDYHHHHEGGEREAAASLATTHRDVPQREIERGRDYQDQDEEDRDSLKEPSTPDSPAPLRPRSPTRILPRRRATSSSAAASVQSSAALRPSTAPAHHQQPSSSATSTRAASSSQPTKKASDMSIAASSLNHPHHQQLHSSYFHKQHHHRMSPSRDSWSSSLDIQPGSSRTTLDTSAPLRGTHTADLADFLRSTGPDEPPAQPTQQQQQHRGQQPESSESAPTSINPIQPSSKSSSVFTLKKYLKKGANSTGLGRKDSGGLPSSASTTSLNKRKFTAESLVSSGSAAVTAAVNKALHNVPPPTNVQPKVFANGHTIYMINTPSSSSSNTPSSVDNTNTSTINTHPNHQQYASPASAYAATISAARGAKMMMPGLANKPLPPPLRSAVSFHGTSPSATSSSATVVAGQQQQNRPKTASGETTPTPSSTAYVPPVPRVPSPIKQAQHQVHDALLVVPRAPHPHHQREMSGATVRRALSPIGSSEDAHGDEDDADHDAAAPVREDYDIQFDSTDDAMGGAGAGERRNGRLGVTPAEVDGSDLDPALLAVSRMRAAAAAAAAKNRAAAVEQGVAEETEEDEEQVEISVRELRSQTPRMGSTSSTILSQRSRGSLSSGHRKSESGGGKEQGRTGSIQSIGSYAAALGGRSTPSSIRRSGSTSLHSPERARKTPSPTAPRQLPPPTTGLPPLPAGPQEIDPQWVSRDAAAAPSPRMVVTAASPSLTGNFPFSTAHPHLVVGRDRSGSDGIAAMAPKSPVDAAAGPYRRDRSMSVGVGPGAGLSVGAGTRSSSGNMVYRAAADGASALGSPPLNPPPAGPPPPTPMPLLPKTPVRTIKASETPRSSIRRAVKARATIVLSDQVPLSPRGSVVEANGAAAAAPVSPTESVPVKGVTRRGSAPDMSRSSIQYILDPKTAPPVPPIPGGRNTFGGYVFPASSAVPAESSESELEKDESEDFDDDDEEGDQTTKLPESPSHSSVYLKEQLENVLKMNDAYLELATADKQARRTSTRPAQTVLAPAPASLSIAAAAQDKTPVLGSPAEVTSTRASKADSTRTVSVTSSRSGASSVSVGHINVAYVSTTNGPPRLPLPPSPVAVPGSVGPISPTHSVTQSSPLVPSTSPTSAIQAATSPQAQITTLTYALHTQRNRYEALSGHLCQQQATWDDQRAAYETRLSEIEREKVDLVAEREQFAKRLQELEKELAEKDHRISQLEAEKFAWERERKGLRWLVTSGRMGASAGSRPMSRAGSISANMKPTDSEATAISTEDSAVDESPANVEPKAEVEENATDAIPEAETVPASGSEQTLRIDVTEVTPTPRRSNNSSSTAASRPVSVISQVSVTSSRTSLDDGLLHPRISNSGSTSNKMKRHSMYEAATIATPTSVSRRPLSAALEDMLQKLRSLGEEERDASHEESSPKKSTKRSLSNGMTASRSTHSSLLPPSPLTSSWPRRPP